METTNHLSQYCKTKREQAFAQHCIKMSTRYSYYLYIALGGVMVGVIIAILSAYYRGIEAPAFRNSFSSIIISVLFAQWIYTSIMSGRILKRISESK